MFLDVAIHILQGCYHFFSKFGKYTRVFDSRTMIVECTCSAAGLVSLIDSRAAEPRILETQSWKCQEIMELHWFDCTVMDVMDVP